MQSCFMPFYSLSFFLEDEIYRVLKKWPAHYYLDEVLLFRNTIDQKYMK